ncbi:unnamed protein product [Amoebophrya sp. A120]|nr:unnamed protein product [Amoebophrya sp. A120]|eukprot:GSA120T00000952001.1
MDFDYGSDEDSGPARSKAPSPKRQKQEEEAQNAAAAGKNSTFNFYQAGGLKGQGLQNSSLPGNKQTGGGAGTKGGTNTSTTSVLGAIIRPPPGANNQQANIDQNSSTTTSTTSKPVVEIDGAAFQAPLLPPGQDDKNSPLHDFYKRRANYSHLVTGSHSGGLTALMKLNTASQVVLFMRAELTKPTFTLTVKCASLIRLHQLAPLQTKQTYADHTTVQETVAAVLKELRQYSNLLEKDLRDEKWKESLRTDLWLSTYLLEEDNHTEGAEDLLEEENNDSNQKKKKKSQQPININLHPDLVLILECLYAILDMNLPLPHFTDAIRRMCFHVDARKLLNLRKLGMTGEVPDELQEELKRIENKVHETLISRKRKREDEKWGLKAKQTANDKDITLQKQRAIEVLPYLAFCSQKVEHVRIAVDNSTNALITGWKMPMPRLCILANIVGLLARAGGDETKRKEKVMAIKDVESEDEEDMSELDEEGNRKKKKKKNKPTVTDLALIDEQNQQQSEQERNVAYLTRVENLVAENHNWENVSLELLVQLVYALSEEFLANSVSDSFLSTTVRMYEEHVAFTLKQDSERKKEREKKIKKMEQQRVRNFNSGMTGFTNKEQDQRIRFLQDDILNKPHPSIESLYNLGFYHALDREINWRLDLEPKLLEARNVRNLDEFKESLHEDKSFRSKSYQTANNDKQARAVIRTMQVIDIQPGHKRKAFGNNNLNKPSPPRMCQDTRSASF